MDIFNDANRPFTTLLVHPNCPLSPENITGIFVSTESEQEASSLIVKKPFNLLIIDLALNGFGLIALARTKTSINATIPILALVDQDEPEQRKRLVAAGFDDCLVKPLTMAALNDVIDLWKEYDVLGDYLESTQTLMATFRGNKEVVLTLYTKLFEELPKQIIQIQSAFKNQEYPVALDLAHKINASAKLCHLKAIDELATALEGCLKHQRYDLAEGYFSMLKESIDSLMDNHQLIFRAVEKAAPY